MARTGNKLTALQVSKLETPGRYCDGHGLWLQVSASGSKAWLFRYTRHGRARQMGLGPLHAVSLAEARERAREARQTILDGMDPLEEKHRQRDEARSQSAEQVTFKAAAEDFIKLHNPTWKNPKHRQQWANTLKTYAYPLLGARPVAAIDAALIHETLAPIWTKKPETARRTKQRIERVVEWVRAGRPLPRQPSTQRVRHHPAMPISDVPGFIAELREKDGISARALEFTILTAARTSETIGATWTEIDLGEGIWTIPAERMKGGREHVVPLSDRAVEILQGLPIEEDGYLFPGARSKRPLSNMAMLELLRGMRPGLTVHGFRSTFRDWAGDRTNFARDVIEHALAHGVPDKTEAAYRRSAALEKRRKLMEAWARFCCNPAKIENVIGMHA